jgi:hypothetical protein
MNQTLPIPATLEASSEPPARNAAVQRCCQARESSLQHSRAKGLDNYDTRKNAIQAYRNAMPDLAGYENVRDFIACTAHGMVIGAIDAIEGAKFLYAAQVALGALRHEPKDQKRPACPLPPTPLTGSNQSATQK